MVFYILSQIIQAIRCFIFQKSSIGHVHEIHFFVRKICNTPDNIWNNFSPKQGGECCIHMLQWVYKDYSNQRSYRCIRCTIHILSQEAQRLHLGCCTHVVLFLYQPFYIIIFQKLLILPCCTHVRTHISVCVRGSQITTLSVLLHIYYKLMCLFVVIPMDKHIIKWRIKFAQRIE